MILSQKRGNGGWARKRMYLSDMNPLLFLRRRRLQSAKRGFNRQEGRRFLLTIKARRRTALWCQWFISSDKDYQSRLHRNFTPLFLSKL